MKILSMPAGAGTRRYIYKNGVEYDTISATGYSFTGYTNVAPTMAASRIELASGLTSAQSSVTGTAAMINITDYNLITFATDKGTLSFNISSYTGTMYIVFGIFGGYSYLNLYGSSDKNNYINNKIFEHLFDFGSLPSYITEIYLDI